MERIRVDGDADRCPDQCRTTSELLTQHFKGGTSTQDWTVNVIILRRELEAEDEEKPVVKPEGRAEGKRRAIPT
jgi:hypothetical protein